MIRFLLSLDGCTDLRTEELLEYQKIKEGFQMTAQIGDRFQYNEEEYTVIALDKEVDFHPKDYGLNPYCFSTACRRGFWCEYLISADGFFLENLTVASLDKKYPPINGVFPNMKNENLLDKRSFDDLCERYENIHMRINYTGRIVLGHGFIKNYYIHMGFQRVWAYEKVIEIVLDNGMIKEVKDHSDYVRKIRDKIDRDPDFYMELRGDIFQYINDSFDLSISKKAWWLDV